MPQQLRSALTGAFEARNSGIQEPEDPVGVAYIGYQALAHEIAQGFRCIAAERPEAGTAVKVRNGEFIGEAILDARYPFNLARNSKVSRGDPIVSVRRILAKNGP